MAISILPEPALKLGFLVTGFSVCRRFIILRVIIRVTVYDYNCDLPPKEEGASI